MIKLLRVIMLVALLLLLPGVARAHPELLSSEPAANAELQQPPERVQVRFNEALEAAFSQLQLFNEQGQRVDGGNGGLAAGDPTMLELPLEPLSPGIYTVVWQIVGSDGHKVIGNFVFTVLGERATALPVTTSEVAPTVVLPVATPAPVPPPEPATGTGALVPLLRAAMLLGAVGAVGGGVVLQWVLLPGLSAAAAQAVRRRWRLVALACLALLLVATVGFALAQTRALAGRLDAQSLWALLTQTRLGWALLARLGLGLALLVSVYAEQPRAKPQSAWLALLAGGALLLSFSLTGHAAAESEPLLPVLSDWLHLAATALWGGGLLALALTLPLALATLEPHERVPALHQVVRRFSTLALGSVLVLAVSGTYAALGHLHAPSDLWQSAYGQALLVKLLLFGLLLLLGGYNLLAVRPGLARKQAVAPWQQRLLGAVRIETLLAGLALVAVGFLTNTAPPGLGAQPGPVAAAPLPLAVTIVPPRTPRPSPTPVPSEPFAETQQVGGIQVALEVLPASIGKNRLQVTLRDAAGSPLEVQKVVLTLDMLTMDMGTNRFDALPEGVGRYVAHESWLSMVGEWRVQVTVRRADADDLEAEFMVPVGG